MRRTAVAALVVLLAASCSKSSTSPTPTGLHPAGHAVYSITVGNGPWGVAISPAGIGYVTQPLSDSIARIDMATATRLAGFQVGNRPDEVIFNAAGTTAWVTNINDNTLGVITVGSSTQASTITGLVEPLRVRLGANGAKLYVTMTNDSVAVLNASSGAPVKRIGLGGVGYGMAATPSGDRVWVSASDGNVYEINTATDAVGRTITMGGVPQDVAISSDGSTMYVANEGGWVGVYSLASATRTDSVTVSHAFGLALTPDGTELWVTRAKDGMISIVAAAAGHAVTDSITTLGTPRHVAFTPSGLAALVANELGGAQVIE